MDGYVPLMARTGAGAGHFDQVRPDWASDVDPDGLDMSRPGRTVVDQLYPDGDGLTELGLSPGDAVANGLELDPTDPSQGHTADELTAFWRAGVRARRTNGRGEVR